MHGPLPKGSSTGELSPELGSRVGSIPGSCPATPPTPAKPHGKLKHLGKAGGWLVVKEKGLPGKTASWTLDTQLGAPTSGGAAVLFHTHSNQMIAPSGKRERLLRYLQAPREERKKAVFFFLIFFFLPHFPPIWIEWTVLLFYIGVDGWAGLKNTKGKYPHSFF